MLVDIQNTDVSWGRWEPRLYLRSVPEEPAAVGGPTPTDCFLVAQTIEVVVEGQLCP